MECLDDCMCMHVCMPCVYHVCAGLWRNQERVSDFLELEILGNNLSYFGRAANTLNWYAISLPPFLYCYFILCVWLFYLHICLCTTSVPGVFGDQNRILDPLILELYKVVSCQPCLWVRVLNPFSGREQSVFLIAKPPLQPHLTPFSLMELFMYFGLVFLSHFWYHMTFYDLT